LGFDFLFIPPYVFAITLACLLAAGQRSGWFAVLGAWFGWGSFLAGIFDVVENINLWNLLLGDVNHIWPQVSFLVCHY
jgi:hypothetical protein